MKRYIKADITTPPMAERINYPNGWYANVEKILVRGYDNTNKKCLAELDDDILFQTLMDTGRVEEITKNEMESEITRLRPAPPEVQIILSGEGKLHRTDIENLVKTKGLKYRIDEK